MLSIAARGRIRKGQLQANDRQEWPVNKSMQRPWPEGPETFSSNVDVLITP